MSAAQTETITNTGNGNLIVSTVTVVGTNAGDFAVSADTCTGSTVPPNSACTVSVTFTPSATGSRSATLNFTDNASDSPQTVTLSGTGTGPEPGFSPPSFSFGNQFKGTSSATQTETVTNIGTLNLVISAVTVAGSNAGDFAKSADTCTGATLESTATCTVSVTFTPSVVGSRSATLSFADNIPSSPQTVALSGTGTAPAVSLSAPSLSFGYQLLSALSTPLTETVTNSGNANLTISTVTLAGTNVGDFAKSVDTCTGATVPPNGDCTVSVTITPSALASRSATLTFADNAFDSPQTVGLSGTGALPAASLSTSSFGFSSQVLNTTSDAQAETVTNISPVNLTISTVTLGGTNASDFATSGDGCTGSTVAPNASCTVSITFTPSSTGSRTASLTFTDNAPSSPQTSSLTGTGGTQLAGVFTQRYDNARSGENTQELSLTPSNVTVGQFGRLFILPVDGQVYAQPLYVTNVAIPSQGTHNVVYVATENDSVYAFDADTYSATPLWEDNFLNPTAGVTTVPAQDLITNNDPSGIIPVIGITGTPVIDPGSGTLYVVGYTKELQDPTCTANCAYNYVHRLHALDITTGAEKFGGPVIISASVPGNGYDSVGGTVTFTGLHHLQRPGLLLLNGTVYIGFGSHSDNDPYHGWLMAYNATTLQQTAVLNITPNGEEGSIWQGGGGISVDESGYIYVVTANGTFDANTGGVDYGESVLKLQVQSGHFQVLDYFTPANYAVLNQEDLDLGSSPALIMPDQPGAHAHLLATGGKDGRVWILNRDNLGQLQTNDAGALQVIPGISDLLIGGATYWNGNMYLQEVGDFLFQYPLQNGVAQTPISSPDQFGGYPDSPTVVSANGKDNAILWLVQSNTYGSGGVEVLYAFDADNVANELYDSTQAPNRSDHAGPAIKFVVPTVANGKVYIAASGEVDVYGLLP